jgi:hypothetical protein
MRATGWTSKSGLAGETEGSCVEAQAMTDSAALAYLARRDVSPQWRGFLQALIGTLGANMDMAGRNALLRAVGGRMAADAPLRTAATLEELELAMNEALGAMAWGYLSLRLDETDRSLRLVHAALPCIPATGDPEGAWLAEVLEGLYDTWLTVQQGGASAGVRLALVQAAPGRAVFRFGG